MFGARMRISMQILVIRIGSVFDGLFDSRLARSSNAGKVWSPDMFDRVWSPNILRLSELKVPVTPKMCWPGINLYIAPSKMAQKFLHLVETSIFRELSK